MKKKFVEAPEIEKEVKRLLRVDNEAVSVKWELVTEEELSAGGGKLSAGSDPNAGAADAGGAGPSQVETDDLFGNLSDLDDEEGKDSSRVDIDIDSEGDSNMYAAGTSEAGHAINDEPSSSLTAPGPSMGDESGSSAMPTSFSKDMFQASWHFCTTLWKHLSDVYIRVLRAVGLYALYTGPYVVIEKRRRNLM